MPIYEYKCDQCDHQLEKLQKISDAPIKKCPECGEDSLRKLVSAAAFKLKGTGWYETDFKDKKTSNENKTNPSNKKDEAKKESKDSKTDSKSKGTTPTKKESAKTSTTVTKTD